MLTVDSLLALTILPDGITDAWRFFILGTIAVMVFGVAKAGFGGVGAITTPMMIYACGGQENTGMAVALLLPLLIACDWVALLLWWRKWDWPIARSLLPGMVAGVGLGAGALWMFKSLGDSVGAKQITGAALSLTVGLIALIFVAMQLRTRRPAESSAPAAPAGWQVATLGSAAGFTSTLAHAAGPLVTMFLLPQQMPKGRFVATTTLFFWIANQVKLIPYFGLGLMSMPSLATELALLPAVLAGALLGLFLHNRVNQKWFNRVLYVLLVGMGVHMSATSLYELWQRLG